MTRWHSIKGEAAIRELGSSKEGLSEEEAAERLKRFGRNELEKKKGASPLTVFINQFKSPLIYLLIAAAVASYFIGHSFDAILILAIVLLNAVLGFQQDWKAEKAIEALSAMLKKHARVVRGASDRIIPAAELVPGDVVILEAGYEIPADCRIFDCADLRTNEASLTGESLPIRKTANILQKDARLHDRKNMGYVGTVAVNGWAKAVVVETGMKTELGRIAHLTQMTEERKTHIEEVLESIAKKLVIIFLLLSASVSVIGILLGRDLFEMILTGIALAVAAVPEGLPAVVTITFALGLQKLSRVNTLVRRLPATETLGAITYIATDKTGTLTKNEMTVKKIFVDGALIDVGGTGYSFSGKFSQKTKSGGLRPLTLDELRSSRSLEKLLEIGALCNHASVRDGKVQGDPTEAALIVSAAKIGIYTKDLERKHHILGEVSFSEKRKMMSVITKDHDGGAIVNNKGAPESVLARCTHYMENKRVKKLDAKKRKELLEINDRLASDGFRVLAIAYRDVRKWDGGKVDVEKSMVYVGSQAMIDPVRPEAVDALARARRAGIKVTIVTGDHKSTATAIAKDIGLMKKESIALDGAELDAMPDEELSEKIDRIKLFARVTPEQKMRVLGILQKKGEIVAMTGDGVNDAPALKKADIGVAMGVKGTDVARSTAEIVLADDNFASIVAGIAEGRGILINIKKFVYYLLSSNLAEVFILFFGMLLNWPLILLPVQLLWINLVTDSVTALSLGVDPRPKGIMNEPPRNPDELLLSNKVLLALFGIAIVKTGIILSLFSFEFWGEGETIARTMAFAGLIMAENYNLFNFKSFKRPLHKINPFDNKYLIAAVLFTLGLTILLVQIPVFSTLFHVAPLDLTHWAAIFVLGAGVLVAGEIYKNLVYYKVLRI